VVRRRILGGEVSEHMERRGGTLGSERASERASTERAAAAHSGRAQRAVRRTKGNSERSPRRKGTGHKSGGGGGRDRVLFC